MRRFQITAKQAVNWAAAVAVIALAVGLRDFVVNEWNVPTTPENIWSHLFWGLLALGAFWFVLLNVVGPTLGQLWDLAAAALERRRKRVRP